MEFVRQNLELLLTSVGLLVALFTGLLVWYQTRQHFRHSRSATYIERFNSADYFNARLSVDEQVSRDPQFEQIIRAEVGQEDEASERNRLQLMMFANIFQEVGSAFRVRIVDRRYIWHVFGFLAQHYWEKLAPLILRLRAIRHRPELYSDFEYLAMEMKKLDRKYSPRRRDAPVDDSEKQIFVFGYGSLLNPDSASKAVIGTLSEGSLIPARLYGFQRGWTVFLPVHFPDENQPVTTAFLDVRRRHEAFCNGVLVPVNEIDLARMDVRERTYDRLDVTHQVFPNNGAKVYAYAGIRSPEPPEGAVVGADYERLIQEGLAALGPEFAAEYEKTTLPHSLPVKAGNYRFVDEAQNRVTGR